jgi:hypothetical protein
MVTTMPEPQELLEMRLLTLAQDIAKVKRVTEDAKRRRKGHRRLADQVGNSDRNSIRGPLVKAKSLVSEIVEATESELDLADAIEERHEDWIERLTALRDDLQKALDRLKRVEAELRTASTSMDRIDNDLNRMTSSLDTRCGELDAEVKALQKRLSDGDDPREVWKAYEDTLNNGCQDLFADYVDCLGGLTLRDTSLDDNVCAITDALLKEIPAKVKHLAVPSRRPTLSTALHGLVKLGFPEWTIWSVPLVCYETGLLHARNTLGRQVIERAGDALPGRSVQVRQELFAEAYAAYTVGPAYGCAAMLLRFQPNRDDPDQHDPSDVERAAVILGVLRKIAQYSAGFREVLDRTREYWREAVGHLGGQAAADTAEDELRPYAAAVADELRAAEAAGFDARQWDVVDRLTAMLRTDLPESTRAPDKLDVRTLLNAAWTVRLANPGDRLLPGTVARNVEILWRSISGSKGRAGGSYDRP